MSREMKDSGIQWIGEIPEHWEIAKFKRVIEKVVDNRGRTPPTEEEGIPLVEMDSLTSRYPNINLVKKYITRETHDNFLRNYLKSGDILFATVGSIGKISLVPDDIYFCIAQNIVGYRIDVKYNNLFWFYYLNSTAFKGTFIQYNKGNIQDSIKISDLKEGYVVLPNRAEQNKIADFLDEKVAEIDNLLDKTRESIEEYKNYKQSIITEAVTKGLNKDVPMKDSGIEWIGEIPEHWETAKIKYLLSNRLNKNNHSKNYIGLENIEKETGRYIGNHEKTNSEGDTVDYESGDILFGKLRPYLAKVFKTSKNGCCSGEFLVLSTINGNPDFYFFRLLSPNFIDTVNASTYGVKMPRANWDFIKNIEIPLPEEEEQKQIAKYLYEKSNLINNLVSQKEQLLSNLEAYKKSIIYECVTGKREVV